MLRFRRSETKLSGSNAVFGSTSLPGLKRQMQSCLQLPAKDHGRLHLIGEIKFQMSMDSLGLSSRVPR